MANSRNIQNLQVWLLDDHAKRFSGAHIQAKQAIDTREKWLSLTSHVSDLIGDTNCITGSTDGLYIISSNDHNSGSIKDVLLTRVITGNNIKLENVSLPVDTIGLISITSYDDSRFGVVTLNQRALRNRKKDTLVFRIPTLAQKNKDKTDDITRVALLAMSHSLHKLLAKA